MTYEAKKEYLEAIRERYQKSTKRAKGFILDEYCKNCGLSRKYAIRVLSGSIEPRMRKPGPKSRYTEITPFLIDLWEVLDLPCSKKLVAAIPELLHYYENSLMTKAIEKKLLAVSSSTIDRLLRSHRKPKRKGISGTRAIPNVKSIIPIELLHKKIAKPGYFEADTVHHCGDSLIGQYTSTLTLTDISSTWTVNRAFWGRDAESVIEQLKMIESDLPFPMTCFASDNGSEVMNTMMRDYLHDRKKKVKMVRRRAYKKNDNAHVEQKNFTHVRQIFGYERLDDMAMVNMMNEIYTAYWNVLHNYFTPTMKLVERKRVGGRIVKKYDSPRTPFTRILENPEVPKWIKKPLIDRKKGYNPFTLRKLLKEKMNQFVRLIENARIRRKFKNDHVA